MTVTASALASLTGASAMGSLVQPRAVARLGHVCPRRLPVLRRRDGRGVLHRRLGKEARDLGKLGIRNLAALAIGVGGAEAETAHASAAIRVQARRFR
jgi:hypothetical protein